MGHYAGGEANKARDSVFIGTQAGYIAYNASESVFIGSSAGSAAYTASNANFIGFRAGQSAHQASQSNFMGWYAGDYADFADNSVFIGTQAGMQAKSGSYSVLIGYRAGSTQPINPLNTIGSNNIIIGTNVSLPPGTSNSMNLGGLIFGSGSYSNKNLLSSGSAGGRIGINQPTPTVELDVVGTIKASNVLTLSPQNPLPSAASNAYSFAVSSSGVPFFSNGSAWTALY
jgi:hypothetical protein